MSVTSLTTATELHDPNLGPVLLDGDTARDAVASYVASTLLPTSASVLVREQVRRNWLSCLLVTHQNLDPNWAVVYLPGVHHGDNDSFAVHLPTGRVFGDCAETRQDEREGTECWVARLAAGLDHFSTHHH